MACATILACFGIKAAFDSHSLAEPPIPHSYSLHSWAGILTISMALAQWCLGLVTFLWPGLASHLRSFFLPIHIFFGLSIFLLASTTALLGITEKAKQLQRNLLRYDFPQRSIELKSYSFGFFFEQQVFSQFFSCSHFHEAPTVSFHFTNSSTNPFFVPTIVSQVVSHPVIFFPC